MHPLDEAIDLELTAPGQYRGATHPAYANMVGPFGGTTAAQLLQAAWLYPDRLGEPVALTVNFAAPVAEGEIIFQARAARTNRSTQHWLVELQQGGAIAATAAPSVMAASSARATSRPDSSAPDARAGSTDSTRSTSACARSLRVALPDPSNMRLMVRQGSDSGAVTFGPLWCIEADGSPDRSQRWSVAPHSGMVPVWASYCVSHCGR